MIRVECGYLLLSCGYWPANRFDMTDRKDIQPVLRRASSLDIVAIDKCNRAFLPENYPLAMYRQFFDVPSCSNFVVVDITSDSLLGYILSKADVRNHRKGDKSAAVATIEGHIYSLAVHIDHRRKGYARALMNAVENDLRRRYPTIEFISLHVRESNTSARQFYRSCDYARCQIVKNYYGDEHGVLMKKIFFG